VIVITAPDDILAARLAARGRESVDDIRARLARAAFTLPEGIEIRTVINDATPDKGVARFLAALQPVIG
jgi:ribose 1,5-bisphosphokinase